MPSYRSYQEFRPIEYLYHYYLNENKENHFLLDFLVDTSLHLWKIWNGNKKDVIELGGGPSLFSIIPLSLIAQNIYFSDALQINLDLIEQWLKKKEYFPWDHVIEKTLFLEYHKVHQQAENFIPSRLIEHRKEVIRRRWKELKLIDLTSLHLETHPYDVVSFHFVPECITQSREEFLFVFQNLISFLKPNAYLVGSFFLEARSIKAGNSYYLSYELSKDEVIELFKENHLRMIDIRSLGTIFHNGYREILCVFAQSEIPPTALKIPIKKSLFLLNFFVSHSSIHHYGLWDYQFLFLWNTKYLRLSFWEHYFSKIETNSLKLLYDKDYLYLELPNEKVLTILEKFQIPTENMFLSSLEKKSQYINEFIKKSLISNHVELYKSFILFKLVSEKCLQYLSSESIVKKFFILNEVWVFFPISMLQNLQDIKNLIKILTQLKEKQCLEEISFEKIEKLSFFEDLENTNHLKPVITLFHDFIIDVGYHRTSGEQKELLSIELAL
ncbi:MAG: NNMT/PNMT/TEMT family class I SAM-dependent methyltransferase [Leptospiraceae bacterium]|nr:NNMT/PNMT/TEMT family class I SAM-dependent methyltransferase [Leptospiraceae bacterium]MDW7977098.1 hypothetical protein [Leptospiraceae bacterium]